MRLLLASAVLAISTLNIFAVCFHLLPWCAPFALLVGSDVPAAFTRWGTSAVIFPSTTWTGPYVTLDSQPRSHALTTTLLTLPTYRVRRGRIGYGGLVLNDGVPCTQGAQGQRS
jgi:hypothetical protein